MRNTGDQAELFSLEYSRPLIDHPQSLITTPALVVLLGSTPALAGLELMRHMLELQPHDLRRVGLVYIDTDDLPNAVVEFQKQHKGLFQEFPLRIAVPVDINNVPKITQQVLDWDGVQIIQRDDDTEQHTFIQEKMPQYFANGAGGVRNNGHVACCFNYQSIVNALDAALSRITNLGNQQGETRIREVQANIVAFLGGGTGSAIAADIAVMIRELLANRQFKHRINLFCMLPEAIRGTTEPDLKWRKSNATACLLELLAFSQAAEGDPRGYYRKYMRKYVHLLTNDPLVNEVYLIGHTSIGDAVDIARIIGLDLFQRITDASGVGFLEHSKWVDRRTLGEADDLGLPTMFGTSCPLEVCFPARDTAAAFAQISAAHLLPLVANYRPRSLVLDDAENRNVLSKWRNVVRFEANGNVPLVVKLPEFRKSDFESASNAQLDILWGRLERRQRAVDVQIIEVIDNKYEEEMRLISQWPGQSGKASSLHDRIQYLQRLQQEYILALEDLKERDVPKVPPRPVVDEARLVKPNLLSYFTRANHASRVCSAYNNVLRIYAEATRYSLLETTLRKLLKAVEEALNFSLSWFSSFEADDRPQALEKAGLGSMAWQGRLNYPHPHQRHIFDLRTLRAQDGRNLATERLYRWATAGDSAQDDYSPLQYDGFLNDCLSYISSSASKDQQSSPGNPEEYNAKRLHERVVSFFHAYYTKRFQDMNLFELLDKAAPTQRGQTRAQQISQYLLEHLQHMRGLMRSLIAFEAELWYKGSSTLETSVYLGMHWRDGGQEQLLIEALNELGPVTERGQAAIIEASLDPHSLEIAYGQHALSLSTVRDFYLDQNSAMAAYLEYQKEWEKLGGRGNMPVHSSGQAQFLVRNKFALVRDNSAPGYGKSLVERVIRGMPETMIHTKGW